MATQSVSKAIPLTIATMTADEPDMTWRRTHKSEAPIDTFHRKLIQAEALAVTMIGDGGGSLRNYNDVIQDGVLWLLADLITEAREAHDEAEEEDRAAAPEVREAAANHEARERVAP